MKIFKYTYALEAGAYTLRVYKFSWRKLKFTIPVRTWYSRYPIQLQEFHNILDDLAKDNCYMVFKGRKKC